MREKHLYVLAAADASSGSVIGRKIVKSLRVLVDWLNSSAPRRRHRSPPAPQHFRQPSGLKTRPNLWRRCCSAGRCARAVPPASQLSLQRRHTHCSLFQRYRCQAKCCRPLAGYLRNQNTAPGAQPRVGTIRVDSGSPGSSVARSAQSGTTAAARTRVSQPRQRRLAGLAGTIALAPAATLALAVRAAGATVRYQ